MINDLLPDKIKVNNQKSRIIKTLPSSVIYSPKSYGIYNDCTGKNVKIAILDSGCPHHKDIKVEGEKIGFCENNISIDDKKGHATILSGIIKSNNKKSIVGLAPHAKILYGKVVDNKGESSFNRLVAGVLWSIVKEVDIIVIAMGTSYDYMVLKESIKKAHDYGICVIAAGGDKGEIEYPSCYKEVFSTGFLTRSKKNNEFIKQNLDFYLPNKGLFTTYLDNKYVKVSGSSISTAFFAGIAAVLIEQYKSEKRKNIPKLVYQELKNIFK